MKCLSVLMLLVLAGVLASAQAQDPLVRLYEVQGPLTEVMKLMKGEQGGVPKELWRELKGAPGVKIRVVFERRCPAAEVVSESELKPTYYRKGESLERVLAGLSIGLWVRPQGGGYQVHICYEKSTHESHLESGPINGPQPPPKSQPIVQATTLNTRVHAAPGQIVCVGGLARSSGSGLGKSGADTGSALLLEVE